MLATGMAAVHSSAMNGISSRRTVIGALAVLPLARAAHATNTVRLGTLPFGTVQWVAEMIRRGGLDVKHGFALTPVITANNDAGRVALLAGSADIVVSDWLFAAAQRQAGTPLCFAPLSNATGGVVVPQGSPVQALTDLRGKRLGVAGGPLDKSWIIVQGAARAAGIDLTHEAEVAFAAPPLLEAKLRQGALDAVLTFWNFVARLEANGFHEAIPVASCARALGIDGPLDLVGFVFHEGWATGNRAAIGGFLAAVTEAEDRLRHSDAAWTQVRPLMQAPDDALFAALRRRFVAGIVHAPLPEREKAAAQLLDTLRRVAGGKAAMGLTGIPAGMFWAGANDSG